MQFEDQNDPRNYPIQNPLLPPINVSTRHTDEGPLMYHDFDYIGYEKLRKRTPDQQKKTAKPFRNVIVENTKKRQAVGSGSSPKYRAQNKDNHDSQKFKSIGLSAKLDNRGHQMDKSPRQTAAPNKTQNEGQNVLPDIVKKGPINNKRDQKNIIGLSLQRTNLQPAPILIRDIDNFDRRQRRPLKSKKPSIENPVGLKNTRSRQQLLL